MFEFLGLLFLILVAPIWIMAHYITRWRTTKVLSDEDESMLAEVWGNVDKMDKRIRNLERILDAEVEGWRENA